MGSTEVAGKQKRYFETIKVISNVEQLNWNI